MTDSGATKNTSKTTSRSRFKPQPNAGMRLEERDKELLCDLFLHRAMARGQIQALYFSSLVRCNARLRQLFDHGFVRRYYHPAAPYGAQAVYMVGKSAAAFIAKRLEMELRDVQRQISGTKSPTFVEHTLAIIDVRIALMSAVRDNPRVGVERWLAEPLCRHEYDIRAVEGTWRKEVFKPDAFVRLHLSHERRYLSYFLEVDLGHTSARQFVEKVHMHRRYLESGLFQQIYGGTSCAMLVVTTGERRLQNLQSLARSAHPDSRTQTQNQIVLITRQQLQPSTLLCTLGIEA